MPDDENRAIRGVQERPTGRSEEHSCESAAPATADDYQLRRLRVFAQDSDGTVTRDDSFDDDVRVTLGESGQLLREDNFLTRLDAAPQWVVGGGAQRGLHTHVAPHVDGNQGGAPRGGLLESVLDCLDAAFGSIDTDDDGALGRRPTVERPSSDNCNRRFAVRDNRDRRRTDDQSGEFAVPARAERNDVRALRQFDQAIGDAAVE